MNQYPDMNNQQFSLTQKLKEILLLLYRFRFLDRIQIQEMLNHKYKGRVNIWLSELIEKEFIGKVDQTTLKNYNKPDIYFLRKKGIAFVRKEYSIENKYLGKLYREETISLTTKEHSLKAAEFYLALSLFAKERNAILEYYTKADLAQKQFFDGIKPDAYFLFETEKGKRESFVEIDLETESMAQIRRKLQKYIAFRDGKYSSKKAFPILATICRTQHRIDMLISEYEDIFDQSETEPLLCKFSTFEHIQKFGLQESIWSVALAKEKAKLV
jgi:hypothetical protein